MSDTFSLQGSLQTTPAVGAPSGFFTLIAQLDEQLVLGVKRQDEVALTVDTPVAVAFGGVANAHVVMLKTIGGKIRARLTSADGSTQAVPVDSFALVMSRTVPVTAIDLTRVTGQATTVEIFLGQRA